MRMRRINDGNISKRRVDKRKPQKRTKIRYQMLSNDHRIAKSRSWTDSNSWTASQEHNRRRHLRHRDAVNRQCGIRADATSSGERFSGFNHDGNSFSSASTAREVGVNIGCEEVCSIGNGTGEKRLLFEGAGDSRQSL